MLRRWFEQNPYKFIASILVVLALVSLSFNYLLFGGQQSGFLVGKIESTYFKGQGKYDFAKRAKVITSEGTLIDVRCVQRCKKNQEVTITIYKVLWGLRINYVYEKNT